MEQLGKLLCVAALAACATPALAQEQGKKAADRPNVEVVFCLDTTGSMGGLIDAAKQKIWSICNQIAAGKPAPRLRVGLVAYRDRGDQYITKVFDLTDDLDAVHSNLMGFRAQGGGDFPESVNQALNESVTKINWSKEKRTLKIIFLVGDAPPQMKYANDVKYAETCKLAVTRDIIINTIQCGTHADTRKYWQEICRLAEGSYVQIDQRGGPVVTIATPFDKELAKISNDLNATTLVFGDARRQEAGKAQQAANAKLAAPAAADRAGYYAGEGRGVSYDLLENIKNKKVKLEELKDEQLPAELRKLNMQQRKEYLEKLDKDRAALNNRALELNKQRNAYIAQKQAEAAKGRDRDSFDNQVLRVLQTQARRVNVEYAVPGEKK
ncbi:MAG: VWA domain-containing protein [Gemmataceae bacterium]|nr:VWA domain-containing protein [Gemmataceae bacterium]